jgi:hypothetical protein
LRTYAHDECSDMSVLVCSSGHVVSVTPKRILWTSLTASDEQEGQAA